MELRSIPKEVLLELWTIGNGGEENVWFSKRGVNWREKFKKTCNLCYYFLFSSQNQSSNFLFKSRMVPCNHIQCNILSGDKNRVVRKNHCRCLVEYWIVSMLDILSMLLRIYSWNVSITKYYWCIASAVIGVMKPSISCCLCLKIIDCHSFMCILSKNKLYNKFVTKNSYSISCECNQQPNKI